MFQSTRPRGARPSTVTTGVATIGFNPRAHGGRDANTNIYLFSTLVSIHAPTGGATCWRFSGFLHVFLFQSTRPRGARHASEANSSDDIMFQSTRPRGARQGWTLHGVKHGAVSIHAPTGGATYGVSSTINAQVFQSTRPRGARPSVLQLVRGVWNVFQSTRPRGARLPEWSVMSVEEYVSIHAPTGGATSTSVIVVSSSPFQSTRPRGARLSTDPSASTYRLFQSTRPRGARRFGFFAI